MNSIFSPSSLISFPSLYHNPTPCCHLQPYYKCLSDVSSINHHIYSLSNQPSSTHPRAFHGRQSAITAVTPSEGAVSVINYEDFVEKDWSFLDSDDINSDEIYKKKIDRIISNGKIGDESKVLISLGSEGFVDRMVDTCPCKQMLVVHDSLFVLACIKEKYDKVNCWQGELIYVPEKWAPFDVVFLYCLPAVVFEIGQVFDAVAKVCSPGARIVISHPKGREVLEQQKKEYPDVIVSDLPDKMTIESVASHHSFTVADFIDEPGFYLAVLTFLDSPEAGA